MEKKEPAFNPTEYLFRKFARMYSAKYGRVPVMTDKYDKANFEMFMMGWESCKQSIIKPREGEIEKPIQHFSNLEILLEIQNFTQYKTTHNKGVLKNKLQAVERNVEILIEREKETR
jgi:hypothetical protein